MKSIKKISGTSFNDDAFGMITRQSQLGPAYYFISKALNIRITGLCLVFFIYEFFIENYRFTFRVERTFYDLIDVL